MNLLERFMYELSSFPYKTERLTSIESLLPALATKFDLVGNPSRARFPIFDITEDALIAPDRLGKSFVFALDDMSIYSEEFRQSILRNDPSILSEGIIEGRLIIYPLLVIAARNNVPGYGTAFLSIDPAGRLSYDSINFPDKRLVLSLSDQDKSLWRFPVPIVQPCGTIRVDIDTPRGVLTPAGFELERFRDHGGRIDPLAFADAVVRKVTPDFRMASAGVDMPQLHT